MKQSEQIMNQRRARPSSARRIAAHPGSAARRVDPRDERAGEVRGEGGAKRSKMRRSQSPVGDHQGRPAMVRDLLARLVLLLILMVPAAALAQPTTTPTASPSPGANPAPPPPPSNPGEDDALYSCKK